LPAQSWLLLVYKIPPEPTARRVYVWRKLKRLGAILLHDAVWVLPPTPYTREQLQWLAAEIDELDGQAMLWEAHLLIPDQDAALVEQFMAQADAAYQDILNELDGDAPDMAALARRYQQVSDYFHSELGQRVRAALIGGGKELPR
jgi:DNA-binding transcriptional regulator PaaX